MGKDASLGYGDEYISDSDAAAAGLSAQELEGVRRVPDGSPGAGDAGTLDASTVGGPGADTGGADAGDSNSGTPAASSGGVPVRGAMPVGSREEDAGRTAEQLLEATQRRESSDRVTPAAAVPPDDAPATAATPDDAPAVTFDRSHGLAPPRFDTEVSSEDDERARVATETLANVKSERAELRERLNSGDLSLADFDEQVEVLEDRRQAAVTVQEEVRLKHALAEQARSYNETIGQHTWEAEVAAFKASHPLYSKPGMDAFLATAVREVGQAEGASGKSYAWHLAEAHKLAARNIKSALGVDIDAGVKPANATPTNPDGSVALTPEIRERGKVAPPVTLAQVPSAGDGAPASVAADPRFAGIDNLIGLEYELALANLSEADSRAYGDTRRLHS